MTRRKRRKKKHWRDHLVNNLLPARFQLVQYRPLIQKIVQIVAGEEIRPLDIYQRFYRSLNTKLYGSGEPKTNTPLLLKSYSTRLVSLQKEDIEQQCWLFLLELWDFYTYSWSKQGAASSTVFYDFARAQLARWVGSYVGNQIKMANAETVEQIPLLDWYEMEDPQIFKMDLGWVALKSKDGMFGHLTIKQKYLLYLRYSKELTIEEISVLVRQHRAKIEQEFSHINTILHGGQNAATRA
jgi:hypothetical protein